MFVLNWISRSRSSAHRTVPDPVELHPVALLETLRQRHEVRLVHLHLVRMAVVPHQLLAETGDLAVLRARPPALGRVADHDQRPPVVRVPVLHHLQRGHHLVVVVPVVQRQHVPAVGGPLVLHHVALGHVLADHAAHQRVVDPGVVVRQQDPQPLPDLLRQRLGLQFLRVTLGHRELAFQRNHLQRVVRSHEVPERRLAGRRGDADPRRTAVHVIRQVRRLRVTRQRADPANLRLREQRVIGQPVVLQQRVQRLATAPEPQRVDRQHPDVRVHGVLRVARRRVLPRHRLAHDHPQRVRRRDVVPARQHEAVAIRMLRPSVVVSQRPVLRAAQVQRHVVRRIGQRPAEVPRLGVIAQQHQGHGGYEPNVFQSVPVVVGNLDAVLGGHLLGRGPSQCRHGATVLACHPWVAPRLAWVAACLSVPVPSLSPHPCGRRFVYPPGGRGALTRSTARPPGKPTESAALA